MNDSTSTLARLLSRCVLTCLVLPLAAQADNLAATPEIQFSGADAAPLVSQVASFQSLPELYEYVRNTIEFVPYHGSRSGSVNTFLGQRGSDVDIASTMLAMLRSQHIPSRYAVGTIRVPALQLTNWLDIANLDAAVQVLKDQGIQGVVLAADRSTVDFEHVWTEALVPYDQYRGISTVLPSVDCSQSANAARCTWVALDGSFKQKTYNGLNIDPYNAVSFDYTAYYNAIKNDDATRRDKNPLAILEEQIGSWLHTTYPGKTLDDVADVGTIVEVHDGLLPASLPYQVISPIRRYDSVADHDAAPASTEPKTWKKTVQVGTKVVIGGVTLNVGGPVISLADVNTQRLTLTTEFVAPGNVPNIVIRLGGVEIARPISGNGSISGYTPQIGDPFTINLTMSGAPGATTGAADRNISASYSGIVGGYYLIATGGESSNWSQVHRAADQLLASNSSTKIVFNPSEAGCLPGGMNCTPYVDANSNGWDSSDLPLLQNKPALDALTGGLLYVAATQYFTNVREDLERSDSLMKTRTPIIGFLGVVSSVYEAEYVDGTAFSILPGGLLIDMKGITIGGSYRINDPTLTYSNRQFEFLGHVLSSLEHETWQELTGYDAVSTVRGIQMALGAGASLIDVQRNAGTNTVPPFLTAMGFTASAPAAFTLTQRDIYGTRPTTWSHATTTATEGFAVVKVAPTSGTDTRAGTLTYYNDYWNGNIGCFDSIEGQLNSLRASNGGSATLNAATVCGVSWGDGTTIDNAISIFQAGYNSYRGGSNASFFNYLDALQGFDPSAFVYRSISQPSTAYSTQFVTDLRNDVQLRDISQNWAEYLLPSVLVNGANYRFDVDIRKYYTSADGRLGSAAFEILNLGVAAGGGYVLPTRAPIPHATASNTDNMAVKGMGL